MLKIVIVLVFCVTVFRGSTANAPGEVWVTRARVVNPLDYYTKLIQEFSYELERREWSTLRLPDIEQNIDTVIANWHANGTVLYTNGFVISIQKIEVSVVSSLVTRVVVDNVVIPSASVSGTMHFRHMNTGYDVVTNLQGMSQGRYTGEFLNNNVAYVLSVTKNLITEEITAAVRISIVEASGRRMIYRPEDRVTEVLSRNFAAFNHFDGIAAWGAYFQTILADVAQHKVEFPRMCFNDCT